MIMPLIPITLAWLFGIWGALLCPLSRWASRRAWRFSASSVSGAHPSHAGFFVLALAAILGVLRYNLAQPHFDSSSAATYNDQLKPVAVEGIVAAEPEARDAHTNLRIGADKLTITDQPTKTVKGLALVQAPPFTDYRYGDRVRAKGKLQTPTDSPDFSYREYLAHQAFTRSCRARA